MIFINGLAGTFHLGFPHLLFMERRLGIYASVGRFTRWDLGNGMGHENALARIHEQ